MIEQPRVEELDQVLSKQLSEMANSPVSRDTADVSFMGWWENLRGPEKEYYLSVLRERAALILRNRNKLLECLPWNLVPTNEEISAMLSKYYPEAPDISFLRECLRWAVISRATPTEGRAIMGARTRTMVDFAEMMVRRHGRGGFDRERIREELHRMATEGHFMELSHGLYTPHLLAVEASENLLLVISGFPFKRLQELFPKLQNLECGSYTISPEEWKHHEIISLSQYTQGPDEIKAMSNSASQYIEARVGIASSNDPGSELPDVGNLLPSVGDLSKAVLEENMSWAQWYTANGKVFFIENIRYSPEYQSARIWVCDDEGVIKEPRGKQWRSTEISPGMIKQIQIAHSSLHERTYTLDEAINRIRSFEAYRFSLVRDAIGVDDETTREFCKRNWLKVK